MRLPLRATFACAFALAGLFLHAGGSGPCGSGSAIRNSRRAAAEDHRRPPTASADKYDSEVWYKTMEPRLKRGSCPHTKRGSRSSTTCIARRSAIPTLELLPGFWCSRLIEVESRFDRWAVSPAGAVGLMQVMPFWPRELGVQESAGAESRPTSAWAAKILRYYLRAENRNWSRALARYNGSVGRNTYPALVMQRWQRVMAILRNRVVDALTSSGNVFRQKRFGNVRRQND